MRRLLVAIPVVIAWGTATLSWAQPVPDGPEFSVNTFTTGDQNQAAVSMEGAGNFVVVWASYGQDGDEGGIFAQRFDSTGTPQGGEFPVNTFTTGNQRRADVSMDTSGNFVVVWQSEGGQDGDYGGIFGQRFDSAGAPQGSEFQINTFTTSAQYSPAVSMDDHRASFVVVWEGLGGQDGSSTGIFGQRFNSAGAPQGSEFQVNTFTTFPQFRPSVDSDGAGNFVVVWVSFIQDGFYPGVFGQRFDNAGTPLGGEFQVNTFTTDSQTIPEVSMEDSGNFVVAWQSYGDQDGDRTGIFAQRFDNAGTPLGGEFQVNTFTTDEQRRAAVSMDGSGNFVVAWTDYYPQDGSELGVFARRFDSTGSANGGEFQVNTHTSLYQFLPAVSMHGSGDFVVVWASADQDGSGPGIFAQRFLPCSSPIGHAANLQVDTANNGADLVFNWTDTTNADDYAVLQDSSARGLFNIITGTAASGVTGLTVPTPPDDPLFFLVAGRSAACGVGPKH